MRRIAQIAVGRQNVRERRRVLLNLGVLLGGLRSLEEAIAANIIDARKCNDTISHIAKVHDLLLELLREVWSHGLDRPIRTSSYACASLNDGLRRTLGQ